MAIAFLSLHRFAFSQVEVSGQIPFNATWQKSLNPYLVTGNIQVPAGVTLTIEPGVEVRYSGAYEILVQGMSVVAAGGKGLMWFQSDLVKAEQSVNIAEMRANAQVKQATGDAESTRLRAGGDA